MDLPEGYWVDRDPDAWTLYGPGDEVVCRWIAGMVPEEEIERIAWGKYREGRIRAAED